MAALTKLRHSQLRTMRASRGAFVKIVPRESPPLLDLAGVGRESPLTHDYLCLFALQLIADFPERAPGLRAILLARRTGMNIDKLVDAMWREDGREVLVNTALSFMLDPDLLAGTLWTALKPLCEAVAIAFGRHFEVPDGGEDCPVCGGPPWAICNDRARCGVCETVWRPGFDTGRMRQAEGAQAEGAARVYDTRTARKLFDLDESLFEHAFDPGPFIGLLSLLDPAGVRSH